MFISFMISSIIVIFTLIGLLVWWPERILNPTGYLIGVFLDYLQGWDG
ncbi:MAG: hypothetical protein JSW07_16350 [bacterium]|nr:MAG: hypothetical protein JSW07_16350 [bacterium]